MLVPAEMAAAVAVAAAMATVAAAATTRQPWQWRRQRWQPWQRRQRQHGADSGEGAANVGGGHLLYLLSFARQYVQM